MARGSAFETQSHLKYGNKIGYFDDQVTEKLFRQYADFIFEINKLISSLRWNDDFANLLNLILNLNLNLNLNLPKWKTSPS